MLRGLGKMRLAVLLVLQCIVTGPALSQPRPGQGRPESGAELIFFDPVLLFAPDSSRVRVDIPVRIDESFFVAVRNSDTSFHSTFRRRGELLVELTDSLDSSVARDLASIVIGSDSDEPAPGARRWYTALFSFELKQGSYSINIDVTDLESPRHYNNRARRVHAVLPRRDSLAVSDPLFVDWADSLTGRRSIQPLNFGGDLLFGAAAGMLLEVRGLPPTDSALSVIYSIKPVPPSPEDLPSTRVQDSVAVRLVRNRQLVHERGRTDYILTEGATGGTAIVIAPFPARRLPLRSYLATVTLSAGTLRREFNVPFRMVWPDMPQSLKNVDYALDILRYIVSPATLDSLKSGDYETRRKNLESFWKSRDASPGTAYNEVMTEYYRRVDHAMRTFGTLRVPDGAGTDRGRIYILYGPPSSTKRTLNPSSYFEEDWHYERLNKTFVFVDRNRNGTYELVLPNRQ